MSAFPHPHRVARSSRNLCCALAVGMVLSGCAVTEDVRCSLGRDEIYSAIDTRAMVLEVVQGLCQPNQIKDEAELAKVPAVLIPDALNVQTMKPEGLGLALGELLRSHVSTHCQLPIRQMDLSKDIRLNKDGLIALTRDVVNAREPAFNAATAYIMTYNVQPTKLTLVARKLALDSSTIVNVSTKEAVWSCQRDLNGQQTVRWRFS